jgi:outer membrane protein assembly factor BamB
MSVGARGRLLLAVALVVALAGCWRQPGYGPSRSGHNAVEDALFPGNGLDLLWEAQLDDGPVRGDPVVSGRGLLHAADDHAAYGLVPGTGERAWRTPVVPGWAAALGGTTSGVTSDEQDVHVAWRGVPDAGGVVELAAGTGAPTASPPSATVGALEPIVRDGTRVTPHSGFVEQTLAGSGVLVRAPEGDWSFLVELGGTEPLPAPTSAAMSADRFWVGLAEYDPAAIGVGDGTNILGGWGYEPCSFTLPPPCSPQVWVDLDGAPTTPVLSGDGATAYVATDAGTLYAVDTATGAVRWTADLQAPATFRPAFDGTTLFVATDDGLRSIVVAPCTGQPTCGVGFQTPLTADPVGPPAIAAGTVYVPTAGGGIEAYPTEGRAMWRLTWKGELGAEVTGGPVVSGGRLYAGTADGRVVAYGMPGTGG